MIALILKYWPAIPGFMLASVIGYFVNTVSIDHLKQKQATELAEQQTKLEASFVASKQLSQGVSDAYQKNLNNLNSQYSSLSLRDNAACVVVQPTSQTSGPNATAGTNKSSGSNGVRPGTLLRITKRGEQYRLQVIGLQDFINKTWALNGQP